MAAGRYITAAAIYRNHTMADFYALYAARNVQILQALTLLFCKEANLSRRKSNGLDGFLINLLVGSLDLLRRNAHGVNIHVVKFCRVFNQRLVTVGLYIFNDVHDGMCQGSISLIGLFLCLL